VLNIDGVEGVDVRDFSIDETIPPGEVWVRFSTGKSDVVSPLVEDIVDRTRAAGIKARVMEVSSVTISGDVYIVADVTGSGIDAYARYKSAVVSALGGLGIGDPVSPRKLASMVFQIGGLADVAEMQLNYARESAPAVAIVDDPLLLGPGEQAHPDEGAISVFPVHALKSSNANLGADGTIKVTMSAVGEDGNSIQFRNFQLSILGIIRARPLATPNSPLQQVKQVTGTVAFKSSDHAVPSFEKADIPNLASLDPDTMELSIQAAAYPGILPGTTQLKIP